MKKLIELIKSIDASDRILIGLSAVVVVFIWFAIRMTNVDVATKDLKNENEILKRQSIEILNAVVERDRVIQERDQKIEQMKNEFTGLIRIADSLSSKYEQTKIQNEKIRRNYHTLSVDDRIGEFSKIISDQR